MFKHLAKWLDLLTSLKQNEAQSACRESLNKGVNKHSHKHSIKDQSSMVTVTWHASKHKVHKLHPRLILDRDSCFYVDFNLT